jgi:hypothetical protein
VRAPEESRPSRRRRGLPKRRAIGAGLAAAAGVVLAVGMSVTPAGAAVAAVHPDTLTVCYTGTNNTYEYYVWCNGTGPTSYRSIAYCADGQVVFGVERWDGDDRESYASCESNGLGSTLSGNWGILLCSNDNGTGTYEGYDNRHGDISQYLQAWGSGSIPNGGTWACEYDTSGTPTVGPDQPEITSAGALIHSAK